MTPLSIRHAPARLLALALLCSLAAPTLAQVPAPPDGERLRTLAQNNWDLDFGSATRNDYWTFDDVNAFKAVFGSEFNVLTPESQMKWPRVHPSRYDYKFSDAWRHVGFAEARNMKVHGHALVWYRHASAKEPNFWLNNPSVAPCGDMGEIIDGHVYTVMTEFGDRVDYWDVVNEAVDPETAGYRTSNRLYGCMGTGDGGVPNYVRRAFRKATAVRSGNGYSMPLIYNEVGSLTNNTAMQDRVRQMLNQLTSEADIEIDGLGMQFHDDLTIDHANWVNFATEMAEDLDLGIYITELDIKIPDESTASLNEQADVYAEILERFLHLKGRAAFQVWGFTDKYSWRNPEKSSGDCYRPLIFHGSPSGGACGSRFDDYEPKPAYYAMQRVLEGGSARTATRDAFAGIGAVNHEAQHGARTSTAGNQMSHLDPNDYMKYANVDFGSGADEVSFTYKARDSGGVIEFRIDSPEGPVLGWATVSSTGSTWSTAQFERRTIALEPVSGVHDVYVRGGGTSRDIANLRAFTFGRAGGGASGAGAKPADGATIWIRSEGNGKLVARSPDNLLRAEGDREGSEDRYVLQRNGDGTVSLRSERNQKWVAADQNLDATGPPLIANRSGVGTWERFDWIDNGDGTFSLRAKVNGKYIMRESNDQLRARGGSIGTEDKFTWGPAAQPRIATATEDPAEFALRGAYPNPVHGSAHVRLDLPERARVRVTVFDVVGRRQAAFEVDLDEGAGRTLPLDASGWASGTYLYRVEAHGASGLVSTATGRLTVLR